MSIAQKSIAVIAILAVVAAVFASFVATIQVAQAAVCPHTFSTNLKMGQTSAEVMALQQFLNMDPATQVSASGAGSPGMESSYFGAKTKAAVIKFQNKYAADVLAPVGLTAGTGFFGASSRAKANVLCSGSTPSVPTPGMGLGVSAGSQPANSLAPQGATRVPFTRFTLTAGNDGAVTVTGVVVKRVGLGSNAAFAGVVLIDQDGNQIGTAKTFNSNDQATIGESMTIPAGQSRTFTVAGNMNASLSSYAGEAPAIAVVGVNTSATVSGSLPIQGAFHTMNSTLTVGSLALDVSNAYAANTPASKEIGTTAQRVSGFSVTAGSAEDVRLKMIRFNQTGSASSGDLTNVKVMVDATAYPMTVSADGKYYTANLGSGILIPKGNRLEVYVVYDVVGSSSSGRTIVFDVDKTTDIYAEGATYGYGISPAVGATAVSSLTDGTSNTTETSGTPYIFGNQITVTGASVTTIQKSNTVAAQNIAINVPNVPLGGFEVDIKGEAITVQSMVFSVATTSGAGRLTNVTLVDENGSVVAGPVDSPAAATNGHSLTFSDSVTFPTGKHVYKLLGKVASDSTNNATYIISTNPSSQWTNVRGDLTGNTVTLSQGSFNMNTMTIKAGAIAIGRASSPASQSVVSGGNSVLMANFQFDATQSGEDVRFASALVQLRVDTGTNDKEGDPDFLTNCQLFDGSSALNTGSNVLNPTATATTSADTSTMTLDNPITVAKGTVKTLGMRCNISSSVPSSSEYVWDVQDASNWTFTGATSGTAITGTDTSDPTVVVTVSTGSTTVTTDASSPSYTIVSAGGASEVTIGAYKFRASNEPLNLYKLGLTLTNTASSAPGDLVKVSIYDGATKVGEAYFSGSATTATSTFSSAVVLPKDTDKTLTIKAQLANVGTSQAVTFSGHLLAVNYLNAEGTGAESGTTQQLGSAAGSTAVAGVRIMKSFPTVALDTLSSTGLADGRLMRFKVTADAAGPISLTEFNFAFATTSVTLSNVNVYGFTDASYSQPISGVQSAGMFSTTNGIGVNWAAASTNFEFTAYNGTASTSIQVPAGTTRYFEVRGSVAGVVSGSSITTTLKGGSSFVTGADSSATVNPLTSATHTNLGADFLWSPNTTTTPVRADMDWTGGYGVNGLPSNGLIQTRSN